MKWEYTIEEDAQGFIACWIEDCDPKPALSREQLELLLHQVEVAIFRQRTEWWSELLS